MHEDGMANAIEKSEFAIICISEAYEQSSYCQAEAHYAFKQHRILILWIMKLR